MTKQDQQRDEEDLKATSDSVVTTAKRIARLEQEKVALLPDNPRIAVLSAEIERLAATLHRETTVERAIAEDLTDGPDSHVQ